MTTKTRANGDGSVYRDHTKDCPPAVRVTGSDGIARWERPEHSKTCKGKWVGAVVVGFKPDGKPIRRKVSASLKSNAQAKVRELREQVEATALPAAGKSMTVERWMTHWYATIAPRRCKPLTVAGYKAKVDYINALLGHHRLDRLTSEHIEDAWDSLLENGSPLPDKARKVDDDGAPVGLSPNTVHQTHRILARALKVAVQKRKQTGLTESPCAHMDAPSRVEHELEPPTDAEIDAILAAAKGTWNAARWSVALAMGLRQGEALGLRWEDVDLDNGILHVRQTLMRVTGRGIVFGTPKSSKSRRTLSIPPSLLAALKAHRAEQTRARLKAGDAWTDSGLVFTLENGKSLDPSVDAHRWRKLLQAAGVRHYRLHDARHAAGTMLVAQGVDIRVAMAMLGHSQISVTMRYQHTVDKMLVDAATKVDAGGRWA